MAVHKSRRSILSLKSWLFTPATKTDRFGRAAEVCLPGRNVLHRLPVCDQGRQDQQDCPSAVRPCHDTSHRCSLRSYRKRRCQSEGALLYGEGASFDRTGPPSVPGRAHGSGQGESLAVSLKNFKTGEANMKDRCIHPNATAIDS